MITFKVFGQDVDLVCKINKESLHVFKVDEIADHPRRYIDVPVNETYYYKINVKDKTVINLLTNNDKFYDLKEKVYIQNHKITLDQVYKHSKNDQNIIWVRLSINKFTGKYLSRGKIIKSGDEMRPEVFDEIIKKGECSKSKNLF